MDIAILCYGVAVAWFTYTCFRIASLVYQFETYPGTFGTVDNISLRELAENASAQDSDLPAFKIVVPAYQESEVIHATIRRLASLNYPRTHFEVYISTYEDEPATEGSESTYAVARQMADEINAEADRPLIRTLHVPASYDGYLPGDLQARKALIGKGRGLNFALRSIHLENERDERSYYIGKMSRLGCLERIDHGLAELAANMGDAKKSEQWIKRLFDSDSKEYLGALGSSTQLQRVFDLAREAERLGEGHRTVLQYLLSYIENEASRFFLVLERADVKQQAQMLVLDDKKFLYEVMRGVEDESLATLEEHSLLRDRTLERERPVLFGLLNNASGGETLFQLVRRINSRWMMVYDADADPPVDLLRFLASRILTEPSVMGFQGPVSPVANYDEVHPLCKLGGLWMGFWHATNYPRLMSRKGWAHPLAGTNWCFRIDGIERDGRLLRHCAYEEAHRRFLLSFDPAQLTEDLEAGIRIYSDWQINAEWHPYVEFEQVPPTPRALVVQRTRWTQGTLQILHFILHSKLPWKQKLRFAFHPLEILISGSGPIVTIALWVLIWVGKLMAYPLFAIWAIILTFGNLLYVMSFLRAYTYFDGIMRRATATGYLLRHGPPLLTDAVTRVREGRLSTDEVTSLRHVALHLKHGLAPRGFISRYLSLRCLDNADEIDTAPGGISVAQLLDDTPSWIEVNALSDLVAGFGQMATTLPNNSMQSQTGEFAANLHTLEEMLRLGHAAPLRKSVRERLRIWVWTFPYLFYQLLPYLKGLTRWLRGKRATHWHKTQRTQKVIHRTATLGGTKEVQESSKGNEG